MPEGTSPVLVKEEMIDAFNWKIKQNEIGVVWFYRTWEYTDADGNKRLFETSDGFLNGYFFSIQLFGEDREINGRRLLADKL